MAYVMYMGRPIKPLKIDSVQRQELERIVKSATSSQRDVLRARIVLCRADGLSQNATAAAVKVRSRIVSKWCTRFSRLGLAGLADAKGRGRPLSIPDARKAIVVAEAVRPPTNRKRWSVRTMAAHAGVSIGMVHHLWQANEIKPHLTRTFKLSTDKRFEEKFWDVVGLYLDPPQKALVLCCDEKSQCQALERTQPGLPLGIGHIRTKTHDYTRHGTVTLFAALNYLDGKIISRTASRHTNRQWLDFLKQIDRETPPLLDLHLIVDNYATHKHPTVNQWLAKHPRIHLHFTPTSSSWMNMIERFFRDLTVDVVREGSFGSVKELVNDINAYLAERNNAPRRYIWKKKGADILAKIKRARTALSTNQTHKVMTT
jgi:transposase